jgi:hypothetical protein
VSKCTPITMIKKKDSIILKSIKVEDSGKKWNSMWMIPLQGNEKILSLKWRRNQIEKSRKCQAQWMEK